MSVVEATEFATNVISGRGGQLRRLRVHRFRDRWREQRLRRPRERRRERWMSHQPSAVMAAAGGGGRRTGLHRRAHHFPGSCADHIEWVRLGTQRFPGSGSRASYGDTDKPVAWRDDHAWSQVSPSDEQLASVVAFERVRFGGADYCGGSSRTVAWSPAEGEGGPGCSWRERDPVGTRCRRRVRPRSR